ncbi:Pvc16 family protein [Flavobacterium sp. GCM10023249]|uniref:Pvc16 family protein n=1 Tax=unclassified Flavobacterium TaxID=196869 RepID=UPI003613D98B
MNLKVVIEQLSKLVDPGQTVVEITNIATLNDGDDFLLSKSVIVLSIVNIEEDKTLKNQSVYLRDTNDQTNISRYKQPTQHLIISVLFASYNKDMAKYLDGIDKLKNVISYFQQNNSFYYKIDDTEMIDYDTYLTKTELQKEQYQKITMESVSLTTEQLNQMWSCLGSKYMPSMLYKMRLCMIQQSPTIQEKVIKKVKVDLWENNQNDHVGLLESGEFDK